MPQFTFDTTIERDDESLDVTVTYEVSAYVPARLYGDYPQPAEGGEVEIVSVVPCGTPRGTPEMKLSNKEMQELIEAAQERSDDDLADEEAAEGDYRYDMMREERMLESWDA